jgi:A/G-specific adenine glycosylase
VDGNVERVVARLFAVAEPLPGARARLYVLTDSLTPTADCGDFAQAMMDLGATICTPRNPRCEACPLAAICAARAEGRPAAYPVKAAKSARPQREGYAYWLQHGNDVLLVRRPDKGLLGGMLALPSGDWTSALIEDAPADADWVEAGAVSHVFTHFALNLRLLCAEAGERRDGIWWPIDELGRAGLPTVFAKAAARAASWRALG